MKKKKITIEHLAQMVQKGFLETAKKGETARKDDMEKGFKNVNERLDKIENLILADHKRRIDRLEQEVKNLKDLLAVN